MDEARENQRVVLLALYTATKARGLSNWLASRDINELWQETKTRHG